MGHWAHSDYLDGGADLLIASVRRLVVLSEQAVDYATAEAAKLAEAPLVAGDFVKSTGVEGGRIVSIAGKSGIDVIASGTASHVGLVDETGKRLLRVFPLKAEAAVTIGGTVDIGAMQDEVSAVAALSEG